MTGCPQTTTCGRAHLAWFLDYPGTLEALGTPGGARRQVGQAARPRPGDPRSPGVQLPEGPELPSPSRREPQTPAPLHPVIDSCPRRARPESGPEGVCPGSGHAMAETSSPGARLSHTPSPDIAAPLPEKNSEETAGAGARPGLGDPRAVGAQGACPGGVWKWPEVPPPREGSVEPEAPRCRL